MPRVLSKRDRNGNQYTRLRNIEIAVAAALAQDIPTLCRRAAIQDRRSPEYLPSECLVHLIREAHRRDDKTTMTDLLPPLLERCRRTLDRKVSDRIPNASVLRDEILGQFSELFADDGTGDSPDELDFYEVRFNSAFRALRINLLRREKIARKGHAKRYAPLPDVHEVEPTSDDDVFARMSEHLRTPANQENTLALKNLIEAIKSLPADERDAVVLCHMMGYEVESEDPNKATAATHCGVTGRTIRNRLRRAAAKLSRFKENG